MPLYEFRCETCGEFEQWRSLADIDNPMSCPDCQAPARRIFSPPNIILSTGTLSLRKNSPEPKLVQRQDQAPRPTRYQSHAGGRPWMINH